VAKGGDGGPVTALTLRPDKRRVATGVLL
jgi:hypothetical protein